MTDPIREALEAILESADRGNSAIPQRLTDAAHAALAAAPPEPVGELVRFPFTVEQLRDQWNAQADEFNQWESLGLDEQIGWAQARAAALIEQQAATIAALSAAPPEPEPVEGEVLTDEELKAVYWEAFHGNAMCGAEASWLAGLRAVFRWGRPAAPPATKPLKERADFIAGYREGLADGKRISEHEEAKRLPAAPPAPLEGEVGELVLLLRSEAVHDEINDHMAWLAPADARRAATLLEQQAAALAALQEHALGEVLTDGLAVPEGREPAAVAGEPSDENLLELAEDWPATTGPRHDLSGCPEVPLYSVFADEVVEFARAVLARWGRPAAPPAPLQGEVGEWTHEELYDLACEYDGEPVESMRAAIAADRQRRAVPVPREVLEAARIELNPAGKNGNLVLGFLERLSRSAVTPATVVAEGEVRELVDALKVVDRLQSNWVLLGNATGTVSPSMTTQISLRQFATIRDALAHAYDLLRQLVARPAVVPAPGEGEGLTDEQLYCMASRFIDSYDTISPGEYEAETECALEVYGSELIAFARAVESAAIAADRQRRVAPAVAEGEGLSVQAATALFMETYATAPTVQCHPNSNMGKHQRQQAALAAVLAADRQRRAQSSQGEEVQP